MADDVEVAPVEIGDILRSEFDKAAEVPSTPEAPPLKETSGQPRALDGKFAPKTDVPVQEVAKPVADAAVLSGQATPAVDAPKVYKAPPGWTGGPEKWETLPPEAKEFIGKREADYNRGIQMHSQMAGFGNSLMQEFRPYEAILNSLGSTPQAATRFLLNAYATLKTGTPAQKAQFISSLAQEEGIDLAGIATNGAPQVDPTVAHLQQKLSEVTQYLNSSFQQQQHAQQSEVHSLIDTFAADPAHEHFERVRPGMAALLQSGQAKDLQGAYDAACWTVPEIRASLISQRQAQESEKRKQEAAAAQRAAVSLTGAPSASSKELGDMSLRASLEHQFGVSGRV